MEKIMGHKKLIAVIAAAAIVVLGVLVYIMAFGNKNQSYRSIKIVEMEGTVVIERAGKENLNASVNMNLVSGDYVTTAQDSYVVLRLDADKYVMLGENGAITVTAEGDEQNSRTSIELASGSVLNEIQNPLGQNSTFDIATPNATMSVRGTVFEVRKNSDGTYGVLVYDGHVAVGLDGMEPVVYDAGEYAEFTEGNAPKFLTEKGTITEAQMDEKVLERLQQIQEQGRSLNLDVIQKTSDASEPKQENQQISAEQEAIQKQEEAARLEAEQKAAELKKQEAQKEAERKAAEQKLAEQKAAEAQKKELAQAQKPAQEAVVTQPETPEQNPAPAPEPDIDVDDDDDDDDTQPETPEPEKPEPDKPNSEQYKVKYMLLYIAETVKEENETFYANLKNIDSKQFMEVEKKSGEKLQKETPSVNATPGYQENAPQTHDMQLEVVGWCVYDDVKFVEWNFDSDVVQKDMVLYPIWKDKNGDIYKPYIYTGIGTAPANVYNSIKDGSNGRMTSS